MKTLTSEIIEAINKLNELVSKAENDIEVKSELAQAKVDKPYNSRGRKVSIKGAIGAVKEHVKAISKVEEPAVEEVKAEPVVAEPEQKIAIIVPFKTATVGDYTFTSRWQVVDKATGEVLNNAQGSGFKDEASAYRCYVRNVRGYKVEQSKKCKEQNAEYYRGKYNRRQYQNDVLD